MDLSVYLHVPERSAHLISSLEIKEELWAGRLSYPLQYCFC